VKGPSFIGLHKLFDEINEAVEGYVDLIAERIVQLGGIAEGTIGVVEGRSTLVDYPLTLSTAASMSRRCRCPGGVCPAARVGIEEMQELKDADSADILTDISRGVDQWLWFVEAHQQSSKGLQALQTAPVPDYSSAWRAATRAQAGSGSSSHDGPRRYPIGPPASAP